MGTSEETLRLFKEGNSWSEIAYKRKLAYSTIENHFAGLILSKKVRVEELVTPERIELIKKHVQENQTDRLKELKEALPAEVTYSEIKWVLASMGKYRHKPINPPIVKAIHAYRALNCFRKCFNQYNIFDNCAEKFEKLAKSYGDTEINTYDFIELMNTGQISICKFSKEKRELRISCKEFEEMKNKDKDLWGA